MLNPEQLESQPVAQPTILQQSSHPVALAFHFLFKILAIVLYIIGDMITSNAVLIFVLLVLLVSFDFWTVKNVTGRLLVGLRYWNDIKEDGSNNSTPNAVDKRLFWTALYVTPLVWGLFAFFKLFQFYTLNFLICIVAMSCAAANVIGYTKCEKDAKQKLQSYVQGNGMVQGLVGGMISDRLNSMFSTAK